jgi:hypothetical protein
VAPCLFKAVTINPDSGCVEWPSGADLCPDAMHQAITGSETEAEVNSRRFLTSGAGQSPFSKGRLLRGSNDQARKHRPKIAFIARQNSVAARCERADQDVR